MNLVKKFKKIIYQKKKEIEQKPQSESNDSITFSRKKFKKENDASLAFLLAKERLFNINGWNNIRSLGKNRFTLYDENGHISKAVKAKVGQYIKISGPGPIPESWVMIHEIFEGFDTAEFIVRPSHNPTGSETYTENFFTSESTGSFRITLKDNLLSAYKIGRNEIANTGKEAGGKEFENKLAAESTWMFFQKYQWKPLTEYLIH